MTYKLLGTGASDRTDTLYVCARILQMADREMGAVIKDITGRNVAYYSDFHASVRPCRTATAEERSVLKEVPSDPSMNAGWWRKTGMVR